MRQNKWLTQFDLLRILAALSVVSIHASAKLWYQFPIRSADWVITNGINVLSRFGVPMFFMISGALLLAPDREISLKDLWLRHILRLFIIYVVWSCVYGATGYLSLHADAVSWKELIKSMLTGSYHLWFLPYLLGIYALLPLLRKWISAADKKDLQYFLMLFFVFSILKTTLASFIKTPEILAFLDSIKIDLACSFTAYFISGYYLFHVGISEKWMNRLFVCFPVFCILNVAISTFQNWHYEKLTSDFSNTFGLFTMLMTATIFLFVTKKTFQKETSDGCQKLWKQLSLGTLGVYLIHLMILDLPFMGKLYASLSPILSIPLVTICCFLISLILATALRKFPLVGRFLC
ncbi:MAG: acyltransferase family protein [Lachnospiraceae bacterium]|nr:acyltransferase family protein [Lachnospiraceae bacterium]